MPRDTQNTIDPSDGLICSIVKKHSKKKFELVEHYLNIFSKALKNKFKNRTFLALFSGSGRANTYQTTEFVDTPGLIAAKLSNPFTQYIYVDIDPEKISAIKSRTQSILESVTSTYINGDVNSCIEQIVRIVEKSSISFAFIDPYNLDNFSFQVIEKLNHLKMDILILLPTYMDAHRNVVYYENEHKMNVDKFLGDNNWREKWKVEVQKGNPNFAGFFLNSFYENMGALGYITTVDSAKPIKIEENNANLYHLCYFTKHPLGLKFWNESKKIADNQQSLFNF